MIEPPVPHGISDMATHGGELLSFFGLDPLLLLAAGQDVEAAPTDESKDQVLARWVQDLNDQRAKDLLLQLLSGDTASVKANLLAEARDSQTPASWPALRTSNEVSVNSCGRPKSYGQTKTRNKLARPKPRPNVKQPRPVANAKNE